MKKIVWLVLVIGAVLALAFMLLKPAPQSEQSSSRSDLLAGAHANAHVLALLKESCGNCHSANTEWPLYARIFPFSLMVQRDVQRARTHMDLSSWQLYSDNEKSRLLSEIGSVVRNRIMPPRRYTLLHPEAKLADGDVNEIYQWTRTNRRLLNTTAGE